MFYFPQQSKSLGAERDYFSDLIKIIIEGDLRILVFERGFCGFKG